MNINPKAERILLYGDSLVYGKIPAKFARSSQRFSLVVQEQLGDDYEIIEEGLRARTLSGENKFFPNRNGLVQFGPIFGSHLPLDTVGILLGTNDCNSGNIESPSEIAAALIEYDHLMKQWSEALKMKLPELLIISPPPIYSEYYDTSMKNVFDRASEDKAKALPVYYENIANKLNAQFLRSSDFCEPSSKDGIHLDEQNNISLGKAIADKLKS